MRFEISRVPSDSTRHAGTDVAELESAISAVPSGTTFQVWLFTHDEPIACCLTTPTLAFLSVMAESADYLSVDTSFSGSDDDVVPVYLENGQVDDIQRIHCIPRDVGASAIIHHLRTGERATFVTWVP